MSEPVDRRLIGAVAIGRNEGARLIRCLASLQGRVDRLVYVDSGSDDGSLEAAERAGAEIVLLKTDTVFTAARARNAGLVALAQGRVPAYVQFIDGDCELQPDWLEHAAAFLTEHSDVAVVCGRRRELFPEQSVYNRLIDREWDTPVGPARACGGDALMRFDALQEVVGFNPGLIAGEEPELCVRIRQAGWKIYRLDAEMTRHDADLTRFSQWWKRSKRAGHAYAEGRALHGAPPERHNVAQTRRALIWGPGVLAVTMLLVLFVSPLALLLLLVWPLQVMRLTWQCGNLAEAFFLTLAKIPESLGVLSYWAGRVTGKRKGLIEYK